MVRFKRDTIKAAGQPYVKEREGMGRDGKGWERKGRERKGRGGKERQPYVKQTHSIGVGIDNRPNTNERRKKKKKEEGGMW